MKIITISISSFSRFGFVHLVATNLSLWVRTIIWESANDWIHHVYRVQSRTAAAAGKSSVLLSEYSASEDGVTKVAELPIALGLKTSG